MLIRDRNQPKLISQLIITATIFLEIQEITPMIVVQNTRKLVNLSKTISSKNDDKIETVPSEFPVSPQPMSNGVNVYVPPIFYLKKLMNQNDTKLMLTANHDFDTNKEDDVGLPTKNINFLSWNENDNNNKTDNRLYVNDSRNDERYSTNDNDNVVKPTDDLSLGRFIPSLILILSITSTISLYVGLVTWRRILEKRYGNSEILLQNEYLDDNDSVYSTYQKKPCI